VVEHVRTQLPNLNDVEVLVRAYANVEGLKRTYVDNKILEEGAKFDSFVRGFNMGYPLCDYIDAGNGKECSDDKLRGMLTPVHHQSRPRGLRLSEAHLVSALFKLHLADVHCKYVVFGGSADNGYARLLGPYSNDDNVRKRITLLEGPRFANELADLTKKFVTISFPGIFRDKKLPSRRVSSQTVTPPSSPVPKAPSYASTVSLGRSPPSRTVVVPVSSQPNRDGNAVRKNKNGQRIDSLIRPNENLVSSQKKRKLCNSYQLLGYCHYEAQGFPCNYSHEKLNEVQLEAQRFIARLMPCESGLACENEECLCGHHCPNPHCRRIDCKFRDMHLVSRD
jgi:hypothetical protein